MRALYIAIEVDTREIKRLFFEYASKLEKAKSLGDELECEKIYEEFEDEMMCCVDYR